MLPEAAALVPEWPRSGDSWRERQAMVLKLSAWRASLGMRLLLRDWEGDPSDAVNFPTAAAAAARPSQLAIYQVCPGRHCAHVQPVWYWQRQAHVA